MAHIISGRIVLSAFIILAPAAIDAAAQSTVSGHVFAGWNPYARDHQIAGTGRVTESGRLPAIGGGVEWRPLRRFGLVGDAGLADDEGHPVPVAAVGAVGDLPGLRVARKRLTPFVTIGVSMTGGWQARPHVGAGVRYAMHPRVGLRVEWRQLVGTGNASVGAVRAGIDFTRRR